MKFDKLYEKVIEEKTHTIYLDDASEAKKELKALGVPVKASKRGHSSGDTITFDLKYKDKVRDWMLDVGWELEEIPTELGGGGDTSFDY
jgi:hypothetical protein